MGRPSHVRDAVAQLLRESGRHDWSGEDVVTALTQSDVRADASSVFRALARLEAEGSVHRVELGDGRARYETVGEHHEHVRCEGCGTVSAVDGCVVEHMRPMVERSTGYRLTGHQVLFLGLCPTCAASAKAR